MTAEPTEAVPAGDRLFALIASIPGSGTVDWCGPVRALLDEVRADAAAVPVVVPRADRAAGAASPAIRRKLRQWAYAAGHIESELDGAVDRMYALIAQDVAPVALTATDRATTLQEAADRLWALANRTTERGAGVLWAAEWLRRLAGETRQHLCAECDHPKHVHIEGEDPVPPGTCADCPDDDTHHDYEARQDPAPDREQAALKHAHVGPVQQAGRDQAALGKVREWVTSDVVTARNGFGDGYRGAQRDVRDLITGSQQADDEAQTYPLCARDCDEPGAHNSADCIKCPGGWRAGHSFAAASSGQSDTEPLHGESVAHIAGLPGTDTEA
ncbi:hypothetical protein ACIQVK_18955 [Streptomyces sp. NPDC090493]|uniref:hypothetical protein n=1 Tax=Streptomyces sp. NPDC090493 TaxID=3365964 RepID=UPI0038306C7C